MRFIHMADTHIGYSAYNHTDPKTGRNQREVDVEEAFRQAVDIILKREPEFVIHAGDLFHTVRPTNRAISFAMEEISRITEAGIPFIVIAGNHSAPRMRETGSVFRIISKIKGVHAFYREKYERFELGDIMFHLLPHVHGGEDFREELSKMRVSNNHGTNIAVLHAGVEGLKAFRYSTGEANEDILNIGEIEEGFDYIAFGHYHTFTELMKNAYYSGSTERLSFADVGQEKGIIEVELEPFEVKFHSLKIRPMMDIQVDARGKKAHELMRDIEEKMDRDMKGAIVRLLINDMSASEYMSLDVRRIRNMASEALHLEIKPMQISSSTGEVDVVSISSIEADFSDFIRKSSIEGFDKEKLIEMGSRYLSIAKEGKE